MGIRIIVTLNTYLPMYSTILFWQITDTMEQQQLLPTYIFQGKEESENEEPHFGLFDLPI